MNIIELAKRDVKKITENLNGFGIEITLTSPSSVVATITGIHTKHHLSVNTEGVNVRGKNASISFSESSLTDVDYPVRNSNGEVDLKGHLVDVKDSTGISKKYIIREWFPDETVGLIVCILGDFK